LAGKAFSSRNSKRRYLNEEIDLAVHSVKDVPTDVPSRLCFPVICRRGDVRDCLVAAKPGQTLKTLRKARVWLRAACDAKRKFAMCGRIWMCGAARKRRHAAAQSGSGEYDAILLAKAGLDRLGLSGRIAEILDSEILMPAVGKARSECKRG